MAEAQHTKYSAVRPDGSLIPPAKIVVEVLWTWFGVAERAFAAAPALRTVFPWSQPTRAAMASVCGTLPHSAMLHRSVSLPVSRNFYPGAAPITPPLSPTTCDDRDAILIDIEPRYSGPHDTLHADPHFAEYFPHTPVVNPKFHMQLDVDNDQTAPSTTQYGIILKQCPDGSRALKLADFEVRGTLGTCFCSNTSNPLATDALPSQGPGHLGECCLFAIASRLPKTLLKIISHSRC